MTSLSRLLKKAHLLAGAALHLDLFEQPEDFSAPC